MASVEKRQQAVCASKRRYDSEKDAKHGAMACLGTRLQKLWVYPCKACGGWHLTSHPQNRRYRVRLSDADLVPIATTQPTVGSLGPVLAQALTTGRGRLS